ncbi:MarR family winged helix-turn-helix transcriptional regulator [Gallaecimonas mangrovi]|uniref:MarR family winged helix-turn-helix transcriptional regulator n=1 Tax=Gallaecimonas mangrovi TaxID=2291597 RepID=UPI000E1FC662|nr:MarR family transcriptional regulator [Gallaecimonas mangrovi]
MPESADNQVTAVALRQVLTRLKRRFQEKAPTDPFSWSQLSVLRHLYRIGSGSVTELAKHEGVKSQSMGATLVSMESAGWLLRRPDPSDGRKVIFELTQASKDWIKCNRARRDDWLLSVIDSQLSRNEQQTLADAIALLERIADAN